MGVLAQDLRHNLRAIAKNPGVTAAAVFSIALALGANTTVFSLINAFMLRPLPFEAPEHLVAIHETQVKQGLNDSGLSFLNFRDLRDQGNALADVAAYEERGFNVSLEALGREPERIYGVVVSTNVFSVLGVKPAMGRDFLPEESTAGANHVAILSNDLWRKRWGDDWLIPGTTINLNGQAYSVIGVMPPRFKFPETSALWTPLVESEKVSDRGERTLSAIGRLKPGETLAQAEEAIGGFTTRLEQMYPESNRGWGMRIVPLHEEFVGQVGDLLYIFFGAVLFMLLIACANLSNIYFAQAVAREREIAIRSALGAARRHLVRQLLTGSAFVALLGGACGVLVAYVGLSLLVSAIPIELPFWISFDIDSRVLLFTFVISLLAGIGFGLPPALRVSKPDIQSMLKEGSGRASDSLRKSRLQGLLVVSEVALSLVLLIGAMLMIRSFLQLQKADPGFQTRNILTMVLTPHSTRYPEPGQRQRFYQQVLEQTRGVAGLKATALTSNLPVGQSANTGARPEGGTGATDELVSVTSYVVSPDYFRVFGIPVLDGREFLETDTASSFPVAIVNQAAARRLWPDSQAVNQRLSLGKSPQADSRITVVGVVKDFKQDVRDEGPQPQLYLPYTQKDSREVTLVVATETDPTSFASSIRESVWAVDRNEPVFGIATMERRLLMSVWQSRIYGLIFGVFAALALILSILGVYGVTAYSVRQRSFEIGVRIALGASKGQVLTSVMGRGMVPAIIGTAIGLVCALAVTSVLSGFLYDVTATDPLTFGGTALLLLGVTLVANLLPALRATRVDPIVTLRQN